MERIELDSQIAPNVATDSAITIALVELSTTTQALSLPGNITPSISLGSIIEAGL